MRSRNHSAMYRVHSELGGIPQALKYIKYLSDSHTGYPSTFQVPSSVAQPVPTQQVPSRVSTSVAGVSSGVIISGTRYELV